MTFIVGIDLGLVAEPTAIVVVEGHTLPHIGYRKTYHSGGWMMDQPVFRLPDGKETVEHPPISYSVRHAERLKPGTSYPSIVDRGKYYDRKLEHPLLAIDATGVGEATVSLFTKAGLSPHVVTITAGETVISAEGKAYRVPKRDLISVAQVLLQTNRLRIAKGIPLADTMLRELLNFRMKVALNAATVEAWREGPHDDLVLALAIALWLGERTTLIPSSWWFGTAGIYRAGAYG
jgi:hypothetical protein